MGCNNDRAAASCRRSRWTAAVVVLAAVIAAGCASVAGSSSRSASPASPRPRSVLAPGADVAAFGGHGELAFVSRETLWVLDGATGTLRRVAAAGMTPLDPAFSPDGRWLSFLASPAGPSAPTSPVAFTASCTGQVEEAPVRIAGSDPAEAEVTFFARRSSPGGAHPRIVHQPVAAVWSSCGKHMAVLAVLVRRYRPPRAPAAGLA